MYQLGTLIESWYGSAQLLAGYLLTGGLGNLIGVAIRWGLGLDPRIHSGGGSVVLMALVGLCAVVGWRARKRIGAGLFRQMMILLGLTFLLGVAFSHSIDNWGHLGGAIVGAMLGRMHWLWLARYARPRAWGSGVLATIVLVACGVIQLASDIRERPLREQQRLARKLIEHERLTRSLAVAGVFLKQGSDASSLAAVLDREEGALGREWAPSLDVLRGLLKASAKGKLTSAEIDQFEELATPLIKNSKREALRIRGSLYQIERGAPRR